LKKLTLANKLPLVEAFEAVVALVPLIAAWAPADDAYLASTVTFNPFPDPPFPLPPLFYVNYYVGCAPGHVGADPKLLFDVIATIEL
jgi:hypothetical protein